MRAILNEIPIYQDEISSKAKNLLGSGMELKVAEKIYEGREHLKEMLRHLKDDNTYKMFQRLSRSGLSRFLWRPPRLRLLRLGLGFAELAGLSLLRCSVFPEVFLS